MELELQFESVQTRIHLDLQTRESELHIPAK